MSKKGELSHVACVTFVRRLPGPIETVWAHLTQADLLPTWYGDDGLIEPRAGGRVSLSGGHIRGVVTQWRPPTKLIYTWNVFDPADPPDAASDYPESYPSFDLRAEGDEVVLTFTHLPIPEPFVPQNAMGWHTMLDILEGKLRTGVSPDRASFFAKNASVYGVDMENLAH